MDVVGSEIGQKMRSAIKAKLTELGCYVDDELPDYVMVMVANKRTRAQMEDDLQLFLGDNTELFVNWLHQVLKKLQEVTVTAPLKPVEVEKVKDSTSTKEKKPKDKKDKDKSKKSESSKKSKKKDKDKIHKKKDTKKVHKSKKKSKKHEMIRPNIPPLLMNMEKESEPSITDVFAGQILKNHGITLDTPNIDAKIVENKPSIQELKRPILPIIDPATIASQPEPSQSSQESIITVSDPEVLEETPAPAAPRDEQIKEMNEIEAKIQGLKQKLAEQLDSMSEDEDFLTIRTEAEELMNDFAEDVYQEISQAAPPSTPPITTRKSPSPPKPKEIPKEVETLPQIELKLPKRPVRERLGAKEDKTVDKAKKAESPESVNTTQISTSKDAELERFDETASRSEHVRTRENALGDCLHARPSFTPSERAFLESSQNKGRFRPNEQREPSRAYIHDLLVFTPEREPEKPPKSARSRVEEPPEKQRKSSLSDDSSDKPEFSTKRMSSKVSVLERGAGRACASVVRVRPRPRVSTPASSLLLRAVADAHKSLLNTPPKVETDPAKVKRALVKPMRRCVDAQKIVIQVQADVPTPSDGDEKRDRSTNEKEDYTPVNLTKKIINTDYVPRSKEPRTSSRRDDSLIIDTLNIHNPTVDKQKDTQFIVTMDGYDPNVFLAKKLLTEGLLDEEDKSKEVTTSVLKTKPKVDKDVVKETEQEPDDREEEERRKDVTIDSEKETPKETNKEPIEESKEVAKLEKKKAKDSQKDVPTSILLKKRLSDTSEESDTQVIISQEAEVEKTVETNDKLEVTPPVRKRKKSPIVFDVEKKEKKDKPRERTESVGSDNHVTVTTTTNTHKYDAVPSLTQAERALVPCRAFPLCRYGASCAFVHPRCKFAAACTRRNCVYAHAAPPQPSVASHVVASATFKSIQPSSIPAICKFYPNCVNPVCHFSHPKPCRYGKACLNKAECNFYHAETPSNKWRYPV